MGRIRLSEQLREYEAVNGGRPGGSRHRGTPTGGGIMAAVLTVVVVVFAGPRCLSRRPVADLPFERRELSVSARVSDAVL